MKCFLGSVPTWGNASNAGYGQHRAQPGEKAINSVKISFPQAFIPVFVISLLRKGGGPALLGNAFLFFKEEMIAKLPLPENEREVDS